MPQTTKGPEELAEIARKEADKAWWGALRLLVYILLWQCLVATCLQTMWGLGRIYVPDAPWQTRTWKTLLWLFCFFGVNIGAMRSFRLMQKS